MDLENLKSLLDEYDYILVNANEEIYGEDEGSKKWRTFLIGEELAKRGFSVLRIVSTFNHIKRINRYNSDKMIKYSNNYHILYIHTIPYRRSFGIKRHINHLILEKKIDQLLEKIKCKKLYYVTFPLPELVKIVSKKAKKSGLRYVVDIRDLWPQAIFLKYNLSNKFIIHNFCNLLSKSMYKIWSNATFITTHSDEFNKWIRARINKNTNVYTIPFGIQSIQEPTHIRKVKARKYIRIVFIGTITKAFDFNGFIRQLDQSNIGIVFYVIGSGECLSQLTYTNRDKKFVKFLGHLNHKKGLKILLKSDLGLIVNKNRLDFNLSLGNKVIEYLACGLPILFPSYSTAISNLNERYDIGYRYDKNNLGKILEKIKNSRIEINEKSSNCIELFQNELNANLVYNKYAELMETN